MNNIDKYISDEENNNDSELLDDSSDDEETRQIVYNALYRNINNNKETLAITTQICENNKNKIKDVNKKLIVKILPEKLNHSNTNKRQFQPRKPPYNLIKSIDINKNNFELNNNDFPSL